MKRQALAVFACFGLALCVLLSALSGAAWSRDSADKTYSAPLPVVGFAQLPADARDTALLIRRGGPFPYARDGVTFGNRERLLPQRERGYYREYTVPTSGLTHRGARRIVAGRQGELYYTDDHYRTFKRIRE
ncbi:MAG TPA: ribonuclease domain-containing protein [Burkholderiales bacterium]|nr:ribonuclease domain-containing protein [Burkholderiales bacterium]